MRTAVRCSGAYSGPLARSTAVDASFSRISPVHSASTSSTYDRVPARMALIVPLLGLSVACSDGCDRDSGSRVAERGGDRTRTMPGAADEDRGVGAATSSRGASIRSCAGAPAWVGLEACQAEGRLYASGSVAGARTFPIARNSSAFAVRRALARALGLEGPAALLTMSEIVDTYHCGRWSAALARMPSGGALELPSCDTRQITSLAAPLDGCPAWASKIAWTDGDTLCGVAASEPAASGVENAKQRALIEVHQMLEHVVPLEGASGAPPVRSRRMLQPLGEEKIECGGYAFVKICAKEIRRARESVP